MTANKALTSKVEALIKKVVEDSFAFESRQCDAKYQFIVIEDVVLMELRTRFQRVERRIMRVLEKKLHYDFKLKLNKGMDVYESIDVNFSIMRWDLFGRFATIRAFNDKKHLLPPHVRDLVKGKYIPCGHLEEIMKAQGKDPSKDSWTRYPDNEDGWEAYQKDYEKVYGKPMRKAV